MAREKTYHRWTEEEDRKLLGYVREHAVEFNSIGKPGGVARDVFWGLVPGRLDLVEVTPTGCQMRYRTLTHDSEWAAARRTDAAKKIARKERMELLRKKRLEAQKVLYKLGEDSDELVSNADAAEMRQELHVMREAMEEQNQILKKLLAVWTKEGR